MRTSTLRLRSIRRRVPASGTSFGAAWTVALLLASASAIARAAELEGDKGVVGSGAPEKARLAEDLDAFPEPSRASLGDPGELDPRFSLDGKATYFFDLGGGNLDYAHALALQPDGKILVAGMAEYGPPNDYDFAVLRLQPSGALDESFSGDGTGTYAFDLGGDGFDAARALALQPDGKIVVVGVVAVGVDDHAFGAVRLLPNGVLDGTFGFAGRAVYEFGGESDWAEAVALQPDGKILMAGPARPFGDGDFGIIRLLPGGGLDTSFSGDGLKSVFFDLGGSLEDFAYDMELQPDGKIVVVGFAEHAAGLDFAATRLLPNGALDFDFGDDGRATVSFSGGFDRARAAALRPNGKILMAGIVDGDNVDFGVAQLDASGHLDPTFAIDGKQTIAFDVGAGLGDFAHDIVLEPNGRAVVVGSAQVDGQNYDFAIARLTDQGDLDATFGGDGRVRVPFDLGSLGSDYAEAVALQPDGRIVVAGAAERSSPDFDFAVVRLLGDGTIFADGFESGDTSAWAVTVP